MKLILKPNQPGLSTYESINRGKTARLTFNEWHHNPLYVNYTAFCTYCNSLGDEGAVYYIQETTRFFTAMANKSSPAMQAHVKQVLLNKIEAFKRGELTYNKAK